MTAPTEIQASPLPLQPSSEDKQYFESSGLIHNIEILLQHAAFTKPAHSSVAMRVVADELEVQRGTSGVTVGSFLNSPEYRKIQQEYEKNQHVRIPDLFNNDKERFDSFSMKLDLQQDGNFLFVDSSKTHITPSIKSALLAVANSSFVNFSEERSQILPTSAKPDHPAMSFAAQRWAAVKSSPFAFSPDAVEQLRASIHQIEQISQAVDDGSWKGFTGKPIKHVVCIGGTAAPRAIISSLEEFCHNGITMHFFNSDLDSQFLEGDFSHLPIAEALFIIVSRSFDGQLPEMELASAARDAVVSEFEGDEKKIIACHFIAISENLEAVAKFGIDTSKAMVKMCGWIPARFGYWGAEGLPIAIALGFSHFEELLAGARIVDSHFATSEAQANIPLLLALMDFFYSNMAGFESRAIKTYMPQSRFIPGYIQYLEMTSNGKSLRKTDGKAVDLHTSAVCCGASNMSFTQLFHQGTKIVPVDLIGVIEAPQAGPARIKLHKRLMALTFAEAEALLNGNTSVAAQEALTAEVSNTGAQLSKAERRLLVAHKTLPGNRPSTMLLMQRQTPRALGALFALYEMKAFALSLLWGTSCLDQWAEDHGPTAAQSIIGEMQPNLKVVSATHDASTNGLITLFNEHLPKEGSAAPEAQ